MRKILKNREINSFMFLAVLIFLVGLINRSFWKPETIINCFNDSVVFTVSFGRDCICYPDR